MRRLFLKIFLWFWGAMIFIALALYGFVTTTRPDPLPDPWRESTSEVLATRGAAAVAAWESLGQAALSDSLARKETRSRLWLFDERDRELSGRRQSARGERSRANRARRDDSQDDGPIADWLRLRHALRPETLKVLRRDALKSEETVFYLAPPRVLAARSVLSASGKRYVLQAMLPVPRFGRLVAEPSTQWLGIAMVLALSGLVCWGLVRYLTSPMTALRAATEQLASGDLTARTGAGAQRRRDEVADLGRDFDAMAERIEDLVLAQRRLLGDISHELRSPLARLSMALALARRAVEIKSEGGEINTALDRIKRETGRLNTLIEQLLQLVRLESGDAGNSAGDNTAPLDLEALVREVVADADFEARGSGRSVHLAQSDSCHAGGSENLLRSAIENVVRNAVRYTAPETAVEVSLICEATHALIRVRDRGPGVPPETLGELFRPFYRVADARDRESGGVGLGLAITQRAVASCGGTVTAQNADGGGLLVEISLPIRALQEEANEKVRLNK